MLTRVISFSYIDPFLHYMVFFFVFLYHLCFNVYFVWYEYCYPHFTVVSICMKYLFHPHTFNPFMSFTLKWVSCKQYTVSSCFIIQSGTQSLLIGEFSPLTFKIIIDMYIFIAILNLVFQLILYFFFISFSFFVFPFVVWWFIFVLCLSFFHCFLWVYCMFLHLCFDLCLP